MRISFVLLATYFAITSAAFASNSEIEKAMEKASRSLQGLTNEYIMLQVLEEEAAIDRKTLPAMIDATTRLDKIWVERYNYGEGSGVKPSQTYVTFIYTLVGKDKDQLDLQATRRNLTGIVLKEACNHDSNKWRIRAGVIYYHLFTDDTGFEVAKIEASKKTCKLKPLFK